MTLAQGRLTKDKNMSPNCEPNPFSGSLDHLEYFVTAAGRWYTRPAGSETPTRHALGQLMSISLLLIFSTNLTSGGFTVRSDREGSICSATFTS